MNRETPELYTVAYFCRDCHCDTLFGFNLVQRYEHYCDYGLVRLQRLHISSEVTIFNKM